MIVIADLGDERGRARSRVAITVMLLALGDRSSVVVAVLVDCSRRIAGESLRDTAPVPRAVLNDRGMDIIATLIGVAIVLGYLTRIGLLDVGGLARPRRIVLRNLRTVVARLIDNRTTVGTGLVDVGDIAQTLAVDIIGAVIGIRRCHVGAVLRHAGMIVAAALGDVGAVIRTGLRDRRLAAVAGILDNRAVLIVTTLVDVAVIVLRENRRRREQCDRRSG